MKAIEGGDFHHYVNSDLFSQDLFYSFMSNSPALAWVTDQHGLIQYMNKRFMEVFNLGQTDSPKYIQDILPKEIATTYMQRSDQVISNNIILDGIEEVGAVDGSRNWYRVVKFPVTLKDGRKQVAGWAIDISKQYKAQKDLHMTCERYNYTAKATSDAIYDYHLEEKSIYRGAGFQALFGYDEHVDMWPFDWNFIHPTDQERIKKSLQHAVQSNHLKWQAEYRFLCKDGSYKEVMDKAYLLRDFQGNVIRVIGAMQDLTEFRELERALITEQENKKRYIVKAITDAQENERKELSLELHDNVNQLLATCKLLIECVQKQPEKGEELLPLTNQYIGDAIAEIRRISHTLNPSAIKDLELLEGVEKICNQYKGVSTLNVNFKAIGEEQQHQLSPDLKMTLYRILQAQFNNILKHSQACEVEVILHLNGRINLTISDNGKGFDPATIKKGLGFSSIQNRLENFNGISEVIASPGNGCTLNVCIPFEQGA